MGEDSYTEATVVSPRKCRCSRKPATDTVSEVVDLGFFTIGHERDRFNETLRKRRDAVNKTITGIKDSPF